MRHMLKGCLVGWMYTKSHFTWIPEVNLSILIWYIGCFFLTGWFPGEMLHGWIHIYTTRLFSGFHLLPMPLTTPTHSQCQSASVRGQMFGSPSDRNLFYITTILLLHGCYSLLLKESVRCHHCCFKSPVYSFFHVIHENPMKQSLQN